jgi:hypothetical protein
VLWSDAHNDIGLVVSWVYFNFNPSFLVLILCLIILFLIQIKSEVPNLFVQLSESIVLF